MAEKLIPASDTPSHTCKVVRNVDIRCDPNAPAFLQSGRFCSARRDPMHRYLVGDQDVACARQILRLTIPLRNRHESFVSELTRFENLFASIDQFLILEKSPASTTEIFSLFLTAREDPVRGKLMREMGAAGRAVTYPGHLLTRDQLDHLPQ